MIRSQQENGWRHLYDDSPVAIPAPGDQLRTLCGAHVTVTLDDLAESGLPDNRDPLCDECAGAYRAICTGAQQ